MQRPSRSVYNKILHIGLSASDMSRAAALYYAYRDCCLPLPYSHFDTLNGPHHSSDIPHQYVRFDIALTRSYFTAPFTQLFFRREQTHRLKLVAYHRIAMGTSFDYLQRIDSLVRRRHSSGFISFNLGLSSTIRERTRGLWVVDDPYFHTWLVLALE